MSGSRDKTIKLWNTLGECKYTIGEPEGHTEWVSCVRFSPMTSNPIIVSAGWDKMVKVWNLTNCKLKANLVGHGGYINTVTVSPDGSLCASGGKVSASFWLCCCFLCCCVLCSAREGRARARAPGGREEGNTKKTKKRPHCQTCCGPF